MIKHLLGACALLALHNLAQATLPEPVARAAADAGIPANAIGLWVGPATGGASRVQHNANQLMNPASVMKLLTSYAALDQLGSAWTWKTNAYLRGTLQNGILDGDVLIVGSGDPDLTWDRLGQWLRDWRARGLREIRGNIVVDASLYAAPASTAAFDDAPNRAYNAQPAAFLVNFGAITLRLNPDATGNTVNVLPLTPAAPLRVINRLRSVTGACTDWRNALRSSFTPEDHGFTLTLEGRLPAACGEKELNLKVDDSLRWAGAVIRAQWQEMGGVWQGDMRSAAATAGLTPFSSWASPTLPEVLRDMNKWSNNVMARQVFLSLGDDGKTPLGPERSVAWMQTWMSLQGLDPTQWNLENGSGLSRIERTTPEQLGTLLRTAWRSPHMPEYAMMLPVIGKDGTMRSRLTNSAVAGRGYVKTGTLDGVKSAAGYVLDSRGEWQAFALILNHPKAPGAEAVVDATLQSIYNATPP
jgi:D-alanyl-D-alanine carboxypeptidase/D-alanyl-D-alanine-endopeptidase (penicillin-binding protein 4)